MKFKCKASESTVYVDISSYENGRTAVYLNELEEPWCVITVNWEDEPDLPEGQIYAKDWGGNRETYQELIEAGVLVEISRVEKNMAHCIICEFHPEKLEE